MKDTTSLTIGLIVNPLAGQGGSLGLKGSDGLAAATYNNEGLTRSMERAQRALALLSGHKNIRYFCWGENMGSSLISTLSDVAETVGHSDSDQPTAADTRKAAATMRERGADIIVFAGGDGTARDIFDVLGDDFPVLGIPAGVKMHSGVFAVSPEAAAELLLGLADGGLVGLALQEVRDIDEVAFRENIVRSRFYGEMLVPANGEYLQHTKIGGVENADLAAADIAAWVVEEMTPQCTYLIGPGSTTAAIMAELGLDNSLLGVDVVKGGELLLSDANEEVLLQLLSNIEGSTRIIVTAIGGQGHLFGRGNQQFSPAVLRAVGLENIDIVAAKSKISALGSRPLLLDTNDRELDLALSGYHAVITGYRDQILYRLDSGA
jgi:predicted polyphosphate/ATP-dependent NAD kinase